MVNIKFISILLVLALIFSIAGCAAGSKETPKVSAPQETEKVSLISSWTPSGAVWYLYGAAAMGEIQKKVPGLNITVQESAGSGENMVKMSEKTVDIGLVNIGEDYAAYTGKSATFKDKPAKDLRLMAAICDSKWQFVVTKESGIKTIRDLQGKKFNAGPIGGGSETATMKILEMFGIKPDYYRATAADAVEAVKDGRIVGFTYRGQGSSMISELNAVRPIRLISLTDDEMKQIVENFPGIQAAKIKAGTYKDVDDTNTISVWAAIAINKDVSEELVYKMTKAYWESLDEIAKTMPYVKEATPKKTVEYSVLPLHAGAIKYYRELGINVPDKLIVD
jgi:hypothetical protein